MPAIVQVKVVAARDLPVMDRSSELTDAFVEVSTAIILFPRSAAWVGVVWGRGSPVLSAAVS